MSTQLNKEQVIIIEKDCAEIGEFLPCNGFKLIYLDPPFNTGGKQQRKRLKTTQDDQGDRTGFGGKRYKTEESGEISFDDSFDDYISFITPRLKDAHDLLSSDGSLFFHIDYREAHYCKVALDKIFGRDSFMNEIIWCWDFGFRSKRKWSAKHNTIFWYAKDPKNYTFNYDDIDRIPYMAPGLVGKEKAERGKTPTDTWFITIEPTNSKRRTGYPTQKPLKLLDRIIKVHSNKGDWVLDFFAGSGTTGEAAALNGRNSVLIDNNPEAIRIMRERLKKWTKE